MPAFGPAQRTAFKADRAANANTIQATVQGQIGLQTVAIKDVADLADNYTNIANWYNLTVSPAYNVWNRQTSKMIVDSQIVKANYTPSDAVPASPSTDMTYQNRALICQLKQSNAQWLTAGGGSIDATLASERQNFQDCMTAIPSGSPNGANQNAGWGTAASPGAVRLAMMRTVNNVEKLFVVTATGPGNAGGDARGSITNPDVAVFEQPIAEADVRDAILNG